MSTSYASLAFPLERSLHETCSNVLFFKRTYTFDEKSASSTLQIIRFLACPVQPSWDSETLNTLLSRLTQPLSVPSYDARSSSSYPPSSDGHQGWIVFPFKEYAEIVGRESVTYRHTREMDDTSIDNGEEIVEEEHTLPLFRIVALHIFPEKRVIDTLIADEKRALTKRQKRKLQGYTAPLMPKYSWNLWRIPTLSSV